MADDFDEAAIKAEEDAAKKQADALLAEVSKERRNTDRLRLKDHGDTRDRRRRSRSRERDRYNFVSKLITCRACRINNSLVNQVMSITQLHLWRCMQAFCGDCSGSDNYQQLTCLTILILHARMLTGHMKMVEKETSIMTGKKTGDLAEIAMPTRKRGEGAQAGTGQGGTV